MGERALLRIAERDRALGSPEDKLAVDHARVPVAAEGVLLNFFGKGPLIWPLKIKCRTKGVSVVSLIVDQLGNPQRIVTVRPLGHGLDEKAIEAVRQYHLKPAMLQGQPVPVEVNIEVNFRIY
jgi:TonB family protein